jgi:hypothetical protein
MDIQQFGMAVISLISRRWPLAQRDAAIESPALTMSNGPKPFFVVRPAQRLADDGDVLGVVGFVNGDVQTTSASAESTAKCGGMKQRENSPKKYLARYPVSSTQVHSAAKLRHLCPTRDRRRAISQRNHGADGNTITSPNRRSD